MSYAVRFVYRSEAGQEFQGADTVFKHVIAGEQIPIKYDPANPGRAVSSLPGRGFIVERSILVAIAMLAAWLFIMAVTRERPKGNHCGLAMGPGPSA